MTQQVRRNHLKNNNVSFFAQSVHLNHKYNITFRENMQYFSSAKWNLFVRIYVGSTRVGLLSKTTNQTEQWERGGRDREINREKDRGHIETDRQTESGGGAGLPTDRDWEGRVTDRQRVRGARLPTDREWGGRVTDRQRVRGQGYRQTESEGAGLPTDREWGGRVTDRQRVRGQGYQQTETEGAGLPTDREWGAGLPTDRDWGGRVTDR